MNEQLQNALASNIQLFTVWLKGAAESTGDFITRETPLFIQEYLHWIFWSNVVKAAICVFAVGLLLFTWRKIWTASQKAWEDNTEAGFVARVVPSVVIVTAAIMIVFCGIVPYAQDALKVAVAPRLVLVEKAADLVKDLNGTNTPSSR